MVVGEEGVVEAPDFIGDDEEDGGVGGRDDVSEEEAGADGSEETPGAFDDEEVGGLSGGEDEVGGGGDIRERGAGGEAGGVWAEGLGVEVEVDVLMVLMEPIGGDEVIEVLGGARAEGFDGHGFQSAEAEVMDEEAGGDGFAGSGIGCGDKEDLRRVCRGAGDKVHGREERLVIVE